MSHSPIYTISFSNNGGAAISNIKINDATPAYTVFRGAACGNTPVGMACNVSAQPAANATGASCACESPTTNPNCARR